MFGAKGDNNRVFPLLFLTFCVLGRHVLVHLEHDLISNDMRVCSDIWIFVLDHESGRTFSSTAVACATFLRSDGVRSHVTSSSLSTYSTMSRVNAASAALVPCNLRSHNQQKHTG